MTPLELEIARARAELYRLDEAQRAHVARTYHRVLGKLTHHLGELTRQIERAHTAGTEVRLGWLVAQERYRLLLADMELETTLFLRSAALTIATGQDRAVAMAIEHGQRLALEALGPAPRDVRTLMQARFEALQAGPLRQLVGFTGDDRPLGQLLIETVPQHVNDIRDELAFGLAAGRNPRVTAREIVKVAHTPLNRSLTVARTETLRAYRAQSTDTFAKTGVVQGWTWVAALDTRTCPACWAMHGTAHPADATMDTHPNCRCTMAPKTLSWAELGFDDIDDARPEFEPGDVVFARLSKGDQFAILGRRRFDAYERGDVTLAQMVRPTVSARWGNGMRAATAWELAA